MLFKTRVTSWKGLGRERHIIDKAIGTDYVFSSDRIYSLLPVGLTSCRFSYAVSPTSRKTGYDEIYCNTPYVTVKDEYAVPPLSSVLELSIFPNNNPTKTPTSTFINIHDFVYAWSHNPYPQYSWLIYAFKGFLNKTVLVDMTLDEIAGVDTDVAVLGAQWYSFVDPTEIIQPTYYLYVE